MAVTAVVIIIGCGVWLAISMRTPTVELKPETTAQGDHLALMKAFDNTERILEKVSVAVQGEGPEAAIVLSGTVTTQAHLDWLNQKIGETKVGTTVRNEVKVGR